MKALLDLQMLKEGHPHSPSSLAPVPREGIHTQGPHYVLGAAQDVNIPSPDKLSKNSFFSTPTGKLRSDGLRSFSQNLLLSPLDVIILESLTASLLQDSLSTTSSPRAQT